MTTGWPALPDPLWEIRQNLADGGFSVRRRTRYAGRSFFFCLMCHRTRIDGEKPTESRHWFHQASLASAGIPREPLEHGRLGVFRRPKRRENTPPSRFFCFVFIMPMQKGEKRKEKKASTKDEPRQTPTWIPRCCSRARYLCRSITSSSENPSPWAAFGSNGTLPLIFFVFFVLF